MSGPGVRKSARIAGPTLLDIAPTALHLLGLPAGEDMQGRALGEALERPVDIDPIPSWDQREGEAGLHPPDLRQDPFEARDAVAQLVELGYIAPPGRDLQQQIDQIVRETRFNRAIVLMATGHADEAAPIFDELHRANPVSARYTMSFARCCSQRGRFAEARAVLTEHLQSHPGDPDARLGIAATLYEEDRMQEAAEMLEALEGDVPAGWERRSELDGYLGMAYILLRRPADARRVFSRALTHNRQSPQAHHGLALAAMGRERFEEAVDHCLEAIALLQMFPDAHYTLGAALAWMKDYPNAIKSFKLAISLQPGMIEAHRFLAAIYEHRGDAAHAAEHRDTVARLVESLAAARSQGAKAPDADAGSVAPERSLREPPLGAGEWTRRRADRGG
jgi:tetratricopeptide (TPR) repeat protein